MMKPSQNLHAQLLLLQVGVTDAATNELQSTGVAAGGPAGVPQTSEAAGLKALESFLRRAGISRDEVALEEGAGRSRHDLVTPAATVALLRYMDRHTAAGTFRDSLPVAGVDGTLKHRMKDTAAAGNARAKTGSLGHVSTLSGYVSSAAGERFAFALMLNNYRSTDAHKPVHADLDDIVVLLARLPWRTEPSR